MKVAKKRQLFGIGVDSARMGEVLGIVCGWVEERRQRKAVGMRMIATAYSESMLEALEDPGFRRALERSDLVLADGVSVAAALDFVSAPRSEVWGWGWVVDLLRGLSVGLGILQGRYRGQTVVGVELMENLIKEAGREGWKVMLAGGFGDEASRLEEKLRTKDSRLQVASVAGPADLCMATEAEKKALVGEVNRFSPDLLFVAFGRFKQEKWLADNRTRLKVGVAVGVGSAFDELLGVGGWRKVPDWVTGSGLKWLWRVGFDWKHFKRAWRAFPVFPLRVFGEYRGGVFPG